MSKYINGLKGDNESPFYKSTAHRLREAKEKLANAIADGDKDRAAIIERYIAVLKSRFNRKSI